MELRVTNYELRIGKFGELCSRLCKALALAVGKIIGCCWLERFGKSGDFFELRITSYELRIDSCTMDGGTGGAYLRFTNYDLRFQGIRAQSAFQQSEGAAEF